MNGSGLDQQLLQVVDVPNVTTIADVVAKMRTIDSLLPANDGLKWFNLLYLKVTETVDAEAAARGWRSPAWLARLDVVFAEYYFRAIMNSLQGPADVPGSWKALFQARYTGGIDRIQFALAGMNAHINHDLALALIDTDTEMGIAPSYGSAEHADYEHVNDLLEALLPAELQMLAGGPLGQLAQDTGKIGRLLAIWNVRAARDLAWDFADHLRALNGVPRQTALAVQDQLTGVIGRALLTAP